MNSGACGEPQDKEHHKKYKGEERRRFRLREDRVMEPEEF